MIKSETMTLRLRIKRLEKDAKIPDQPYAGDAGFDLYALENVALEPGVRTGVRTGISMAIPEGYVGLIWDKSGVSIKKGQKTLAGVVDSGYRGEVLVGMVNLSDETYTFKKGDKVAQMLIQKVESIHIEEVDELDDTERGEKGFGSSGK